MKNKTTKHQGHPIPNDCIVTEQDPREGLRYMRRTQFYKTLTQCIEYKDEE